MCFAQPHHLVRNGRCVGMAAGCEIRRGAVQRWRHAQADMLVLHGCGRRHQPHSSSGENWFAILHAKGFEQKKRLVKVWRDFAKRQLAIELQLRFEIGGSEPGARVAIQMLAQLFDIGAGQRKTHRVRVAAVARKQFGHDSMACSK